MDTLRYAQLFVSEGRELVSRMNEALLSLEHASDSAPHVDALFRATHTMKGMAGAMAYEPIADAAHALESVLALVRDGTVAATPELINALFAGADWLEASIERVAVDGNAAACSPTVLLDQLAASGGGVVSRGVVSPGGGGALRPTPIWTSAIAAAAPQVAAADGRTSYRIRVRQVADAPLRGVRATMALARARALGALSDVEPNEGSLVSEAFGTAFSFALTTGASPAEIERELRLAGEVDTVEIRAADVGGAQLRPTPVSTRLTPDESAAPRAADSSVRVELQRLDALMAVTGELVIARGRFAELAARHADPALEEAAAQLTRLVATLQDEVLATRMVPAGQVFDRFPRFVRDTARAVGKEVRFALVGRDIELDRALLDAVGEPLVHLLRNALDHGLESVDDRIAAGKPAWGTITLAVSRERDSVVIRVTDDGRGVDRAKVVRRAREAGLLAPGIADVADDELLRLLGTAGLSTAERVTTLSGRGVGVDAVVAVVRRLSGTVDLRTVAGEGTSWSLRLPVTLAIVGALLARVGDEVYALPATHVRATTDLVDAALATVRGRDVIVYGDEVLPVVRLRAIVGLPRYTGTHEDIVVLAAEERRVALLVDELLSQEEIVVKPFDAARDGGQLFSGATVLADGAPALILDVGGLL